MSLGAANAIELRGVRIALPAPLEPMGPLSLHFAAGETVALMGSTGGGRQALLETLELMRPPLDGTIRLMGEIVDFSDERALRRTRARIGIAIRRSGLLSNMTVMGNLMLPVRYHQPERLEAAQAFVNASLRDLGLASQAMALPAALDPARQKLAAIVRALATEPALVVIEEPLEVADAEMTATLTAYLQRYLDRTGATLVFTSSGLPLIEALARRVLGLESGVLLRDHRFEPRPVVEVDLR